MADDSEVLKTGTQERWEKVLQNANSPWWNCGRMFYCIHKRCVGFLVVLCIRVGEIEWNNIITPNPALKINVSHLILGALENYNIQDY